MEPGHHSTADIPDRNVAAARSGRRHKWHRDSPINLGVLSRHPEQSEIGGSEYRLAVVGSDELVSA